MDVESDDNFLLFFLLFRVIEQEQYDMIILSTYIYIEIQPLTNFINTVLIKCKVNNFPLNKHLKTVEIAIQNRWKTNVQFISHFGYLLLYRLLSTLSKFFLSILYLTFHTVFNIFVNIKKTLFQLCGVIERVSQFMKGWWMLLKWLLPG